MIIANGGQADLYGGHGNSRCLRLEQWDNEKFAIGTKTSPRNNSTGGSFVFGRDNVY